MQSRILYAFSILFLVFIAVPVHAQWEAVTVPGDESINQVERNAQYWYALGGYNLYRSSDDGQRWEVIREGLGFGSSIACQGDTVYLFNYNESLLRSKDGGITWDTLSGPYNLSVNSSDISIGNEFLFVPSINKLYRFNKNIPASSPEIVYASGGFISALPRVAAIGPEVFFTINDSLMYSNDAGSTWSLLHKGFFANAIAYHADTLVIISTNNTHRSINKGQSWESFTQYLGYSRLSYADGRWKSYISGSGVHLVSQNGGAEWQPLALPRTHIRNFRQKDNLIITSHSEGVLRSVDGGQNWENPVGGFKQEFIASIADGPFELGGLLRVNSAYTTDEGLSWIQPILATSVTSLPLEHKGSFYLMGSDKRIYKSNSILTNWSLVSNEIQSTGSYFISTGNNLYLICQNLVAEDSMYILESKDLGVSWQPTGGVFQRSGYNNLVAHNGYLYLIMPDLKLNRSLDGGLNWETVTTLPAGIGASNPIYFESHYGKLFILTYSNLLASHDNGVNFIKLNNANQGIAGFSNIAYDGTYLVSNLNNKLYLSNGIGSNWINITENLSSLNFTELTLAIHKGYIYIGDQAQPLLFRRKLSPLETAQLSGEVYQDDNNNGIKDAGEAPLGGIYLKAGNGSYTTSKQDGTFSFNAYLDRDTIQALVPKNWMQVNPEKRFVQGNQGGLQFGIYTPPGIFDFSCRLTAFQPFRPGFQQQIALNWKQTGSASGTAVLSCVLSAPAQFLSASITPNQIKGDTLVWNLSNIQGGQSGTVILEVTIPANVPLGTPLRVTADIFPVNATDIYPPDNKSELNSEVVGAYDPNDKQCTPEYFSLQDLDIPPPLTYTIRFQNEGNFPAEFVRILDTLDYTHLDVSSLEVLATSHPCETRLEGNGIVEFFFGNIQLPPKSSDEAGSQGFVQYRIQPKRGLPVWVNIKNRAHIFFDFNAPIVTNTTETGVQLPVRVRDAFDPVQRLKAWPNPSAGLVSVELPEIGGILSLFDAFGRLIEQRKATQITEQFDLSAYPAGLYRVFWMGDSGQRVCNTTLVKQ